MVKLRTLLTVFTLILRAEAQHAACGVRPITMSWVSWPIRADCALEKTKRLSQWAETFLFAETW